MKTYPWITAGPYKGSISSIDGSMCFVGWIDDEALPMAIRMFNEAIGEYDPDDDPGEHLATARVEREWGRWVPNRQLSDMIWHECEPHARGASQVTWVYW